MSDRGRFVLLRLTEREKTMVQFALWNFMNAAHAQAEFHAQKRNNTTAAQELEASEKVKKFHRDADDAGNLLKSLRDTK